MHIIPIEIGVLLNVLNEINFKNLYYPLVILIYFMNEKKNVNMRRFSFQ